MLATCCTAEINAVSVVQGADCPFILPLSKLFPFAGGNVVSITFVPPLGAQTLELTDLVRGTAGCVLVQGSCAGNILTILSTLAGTLSHSRVT